MNEITLAGCTPTPLAHYLKALGIFRLVAEQKDPAVKAYWQGERFTLVTQSSREEIARFFLDEYQPTPILSPWNGRAGYLEGENADDSTRRGPVLLERFRNCPARRLAPYRDLIRILDEMEPLLEMNAIRATKKALDKEKNERKTAWSEEKKRQLAFATAREAFLKEQLLNLLRNALPDEHLAWLDAAVAIGSEKAFAPLLGGSGGVEGSMDIGVNFMDNILSLIDFSSELGSASANSPNWLRNAIDGSIACLTAKNKAGSLYPDRIGGPNATSGFSHSLNINPWDFVFMIEGAIAFKPTMTRKFGTSDHARLSYPFTVEPSSIGSGSVSSDDEKRTRAGASEIWAPLWSASAGYSEIVVLLREGSIRLGSKIPRDGLDMARCIGKLGIDRGICAFERFLFLKRLGDNDIAVRLNRFELTERSAPNVSLIRDLDRGNFLDLLRRASRSKETPASLKRAISKLENAIFSLTRPSAARSAVQRTLILIGEVMQAIAVCDKGQKAVPVLPSLSSTWISESGDDSAEFRLALALASLPGMCAHIAPIAQSRTNRRWQWHKDSRRYVWGNGDLTRNLVRIANRRLIDSRRRDAVAEPFGTHATLGAQRSDIQALISKRTNDVRISELLQGLIWVSLSDTLSQCTNLGNAVESEAMPLPAAYRVCKPFFAPEMLLRQLNRLPDGCQWFMPEQIPRLLAAGQVQQALTVAWRRSGIAGLGWPAGPCPETTVDIDGPRLLAALTIPIKRADLARLIPRVKNQKN